MSCLFRVLTLDSKGKTAVIAVKAVKYEQARVAAVDYLTHQPAVVLTCISETPL